jgi:hypothetical protein
MFGVALFTLKSYAVTALRNSQTQQRCGELRDYAVTTGPLMCARVCMRVRVRTHGPYVSRNCVTA